MQQVGCPARARPDARVRDIVSRPSFSIACHRSVLPVWSGRQQVLRSPQRLHVSCPAVEQDTEVPSTSGRPHADSDIIQALFTNEPPTLTEPLPDLRKELNARIKAAGSLPQLCDLVQQEAQQFDYLTSSHALYRLSIMCHAYFTQLQSAHLASRESQQVAWMEYVEPTLQMLGQLLLRHMDSCDPWAVTISLWAYGNLQYTDEAVLAALCERGLQTMHAFTALDCASSLVGIAKLRVRPRCQREFVDHLLSHTHDLLSQVDSWGSQEVANVVWALSKMGAAGPSRRALLEGLLEMTLWRMADFRVQELSIIVYSCGRLRLRLPLQMVRITNHLAAHLTELNPQDAANVLWGCAKLDFKPGPELLERLPHVMVGRLSEFKPQEVCNLLYGYGHLRYEHTTLLEGVAKACTPRLHEFSTQDLCLTLWSYGMLRYCPANTALFDTACGVLLQRGNRLLPMELVMAVKGFARAGYQPPPEFMQQIAQLSILKLHQFKPIEWAQLLWSYAQVGYRDVPLFEAVVSHTIHMLQTWSRRLPKTTVDTILLSCERVGFWPQMLVDVAEMRGLYLKTSNSKTADMEELVFLGQASGGVSDVTADAAADEAAISSNSSELGSSCGDENPANSPSRSSRPQLFAGDLSTAAASWQQQQQQVQEAASPAPLWPDQASQQQQQQPEAQHLNGNSSRSRGDLQAPQKQQQQREQQQQRIPIKGRELQQTHLQQPPKRVVQPPQLPQQQQHRTLPVAISAAPPLAATGTQQTLLQAVGGSSSSSSHGHNGTSDSLFLPQQQ